ncbi:hypothetical protein FOE78_07055 [Microlunatus elymi]|uniref:Uncharacterized protein n=1 Tax=Microlunatus elymi TaxID=2596828 RepID=A0A516PWZ1_9ACTN|nr:hypothetical protein [Microlunatus elymi]QDP95696.1 hypothetical protein FOE78_07055 [Microlunatus elymi]
MQAGHERAKWIEFADQPFFSLADFIAESKGKTGAELEEIQQRYWPAGTDGNGITRMRLFKDPDGAVGLSLRDTDGVERIRLVVDAEGGAKMIMTARDGSIWQQPAAPAT